MVTRIVWRARLQTLSRRRIWLWFGVATAVVWVVYRPDQSRPFYIIDFSEFIPPLERHSGWAQRTIALTDYYITQGRFGVLAYALLAAKWGVLGWWTTGWQLARAALMLGLVVLAYQLVRRLGASRLGALVGASVFLWAPAASDGWVRLNMSEPLGTAVVLAASIRATRFQGSGRWGREAAVLGIACAIVILIKELLVPLLLLPVVLALTIQPDGSFALPRRERRNVALLLTVAAITASALLPVALVFLRADNSAYASLYGQAMLAPAGLLAIWITSFIPFDPVPPVVNVAWVLAFLGLIILLSAGWRVGLQRPDADRRARWLIAIALLIPLVGIMAYLPSPWFARFYALPYLTGAAILLGMAATYLEDVPTGRTWLLSTCAAMALYAATGAATLAAQTAAVQERDDAIIEFLADSVDADSVLFATTILLPAEWRQTASPTGAPRGLGATFARHAGATQRPWPPTRDVDCGEARDALQAATRHIVVLNLASSCALGVEPGKVIARHFHRIDWRGGRIIVDSAHARLFKPPSGPARP
jgi:hypothetical protein